MAKVKIGLIENMFVTNPKLNPKVHRIVDRKRMRRVEQPAHRRKLFAACATCCEIQPLFMSRSWNTLKKPR